MSVMVRTARASDGEALAAIYAPHVTDGTASFEVVAPDAAAMAARVEATLPRLPWLVREDEGRATGYAYASRHRDREAYQWCVEVSVYVAAGGRRRGTARALYGALFELLRAQGYANAYAGITVPNPPSIALHEALGFRRVGIYPRIGWKHGAWLDVGWWALRLGEPPAPPKPPIPFAELADGEACRQALERAGARLAL